MNVPIFFLCYGLGFMIFAWIIDLGVDVFEQRIEVGIYEGWYMRKKWRWRIMTTEWRKYVVAANALIWPILMLQILRGFWFQKQLEYAVQPCTQFLRRDTCDGWAPPSRTCLDEDLWVCQCCPARCLIACNPIYEGCELINNEWRDTCEESEVF